MKQGSSSKKHASELTRVCSILLGELSNGKASLTSHSIITLADIENRFNLKEKDAKRVLHIISQFSSSEFDTSIPFIDSSDSTELRLSPYSNFRGHQTRLNKNESIALAYALTQAGFNDEDIFDLLDGLLVYNDKARNEIKQYLIDNQIDSLNSSLTQSCFCCLLNRRMYFSYQSNNDKKAKYRTVDPLYIYFKEGYWYLSAWDIKADFQKTYKIDKISDIQQMDGYENHESATYDHDFSFMNSDKVELTFTNKNYFIALDWYGIEVTEKTEEYIKGLIPWSGDDWLPKQIAATANTVTANNENVMKRVSEIKAEQLNIYIKLIDILA